MLGGPFNYEEAHVSLREAAAQNSALISYKEAPQSVLHVDEDTENLNVSEERSSSTDLPYLDESLFKVLL